MRRLAAIAAALACAAQWAGASGAPKEEKAVEAKAAAQIPFALPPRLPAASPEFIARLRAAIEGTALPEARGNESKAKPHPAPNHTSPPTDAKGH